MPHSPPTHWVPARFTCLTDDQIGVIQARLHDLKERAQERAQDLADEYGVSHATIYRVKNAVPKHLLTIDEVGLANYRKDASRGKLRKLRRKVS